LIPQSHSNHPAAIAQSFSRTVKSYAFQDLPRKRIKKLAAQFSDEEVRQSLGEDDHNRAFIFEQPDGTASVMRWNAFNGPMIILDDDSVRAYAQLDYLRRHGYPCFRSLDEIQIHAERHSWPRKNRNELGGNA
jgi:hypothetical protein